MEESSNSLPYNLRKFVRDKTFRSAPNAEHDKTVLRRATKKPARCCNSLLGFTRHGFDTEIPAIIEIKPEDAEEKWRYSVTKEMMVFERPTPQVASIDVTPQEWSGTVSRINHCVKRAFSRTAVCCQALVSPLCAPCWVLDIFCLFGCHSVHVSPASEKLLRVVYHQICKENALIYLKKGFQLMMTIEYGKSAAQFCTAGTEYRVSLKLIAFNLPRLLNQNDPTTFRLASPFAGHVEPQEKVILQDSWRRVAVKLIPEVPSVFLLRMFVFLAKSMSEGKKSTVWRKRKGVGKIKDENDWQDGDKVFMRLTYLTLTFRVDDKSKFKIAVISSKRLNSARTPYFGFVFDRLFEFFGGFVRLLAIKGWIVPSKDKLEPDLKYSQEHVQDVDDDDDDHDHHDHAHGSFRNGTAHETEMDTTNSHSQLMHGVVGSGADSSVKDEWVEYADENGEKYWHNASTNQSRWDNPHLVLSTPQPHEFSSPHANKSRSVANESKHNSVPDTPPDQWDVEEVCAWCRANNLDKLVSKFQRKGVTGTRLMQINATSLRNEYQVFVPGEIDAFLSAQLSLRKR